MTHPRSLLALNALPLAEREQRYGAVIPPALLQRFNLDPQSFTDSAGNKLLTLTTAPGSPSVEMDLRSAPGAPDPLFYAHLTENLNNQLVVLLAIINDPTGPRFDVDKLPDGTKTQFGTFKRNLPAEAGALGAGLAPGQVRRGLRLMREMLVTFDAFVKDLGREMFFIEPLTYHNAILFERHGFAYQQGKRWMESIHFRFTAEGDLPAKLEDATPFRQPAFANSIRGRSWAIHDGILGEPYTGVHMYKFVGKQTGVNTFPEGEW